MNTQELLGIYETLDARIKNRASYLRKSMFEQESAIINQISTSRSDYVCNCNFFNNDSLDIEKLSDYSYSKTIGLAKSEEVLCIEDTSSFNFIHHGGDLRIQDPDLGLVGDSRSAGFFLHPCLVLKASNSAVLGISDIQIWNRGFMPHQKDRDYKKISVEEKESYRWIKGAQLSSQRLQEAKRITVIADREADMYEALVEIPCSNTEILIRSNQNRRLYENDLTLGDQLEAFSPSGSCKIPIKGNERRRGRLAEFQIKFGSVKIARPSTTNKTYPDYVSVDVVEIKEVSKTVPKDEEPICWKLITTHQVKDLEQAKQIIYWYSQRWQIEQLFRILKQKGLQVEACQLTTGIALKRMTVIALDTATKVLKLVQERHGANDIDAKEVFDEQEIELLTILSQKLEGNTEKQKNPYRPNSLAWAAWVIARLGNWKGYQSADPPGPITMKRGLEKFSLQFIGWKLAKDLN